MAAQVDNFMAMVRAHNNPHTSLTVEIGSLGLAQDMAVVETGFVGASVGGDRANGNINPIVRKVGDTVQQKIHTRIARWGDAGLSLLLELGIGIALKSRIAIVV